jgi:hypothetical protein
MKGTKKVIGLIVALVLCAGLLAACGGTTETTKYTLTVNGGTGGGTYDTGTQVTVTATVPSGKEFVAWFEGETQVSTANPYTFAITKNITLTATFEDESGNTDTDTAFVPYDFSGVQFNEPAAINGTTEGLISASKAMLENTATTDWRRQCTAHGYSGPYMDTKSGSGDATRHSAVYSDGSASYYSKSSDGHFFKFSQETDGELSVSNVYDTSTAYLNAIKSTVNYTFELETSAFTFKKTFKKGVFEGKDLYVITGDFSYDYHTDLGGGRYAFFTTYNTYILDGKVIMAEKIQEWFASADDFGGTPVDTWHTNAHIEWNYSGGVKMPTAWESKVSAEPGKSFATAIEITPDGTELSCGYDGAPVWVKVPLTANVAYNLTLTVYDAAGTTVSAECTGITAGRYSSATSTDGSFTSDTAILTGVMDYPYSFTGYLKITLSGVTNATIKGTFAPVG